MKVLNKLFILFFLSLFTSCYTVVDNEKIGKYLKTNEPGLYSFPANSIIDKRLIGRWKRTFTEKDMNKGIQYLHFTKYGSVEYKKNIEDFLRSRIWGQFRTSADTLYLKFSNQNLIEKMLLIFRNDQMFLEYLESPFSDGHYSIETHPARNGFIFIGE